MGSTILFALPAECKLLGYSEDNLLNDNYEGVMDKVISDLLDEGQSALNLGRPERANTLFTRAINLARSRSDIPGEAQATLAMAVNAMHFLPLLDGDPFLQRKQLCAKALNLFRKIGDQNGVCRCLLVTATVETTTRALEICQSVLNTAKMTEDDLLVGKAQRVLGCVLNVAGEKEAAVEHLREAIEIAERLDNRELMAQSMISAGLCSGFKELERCILFDQGIDLLRELGQKNDLLINLMSRITVLPVSWTPAQKECVLQETLCLAEELGRQELIPICYKALMHSGSQTDT